MGLFEGKSVIVTGGAAGIGEATARRFSALGAKVLVADVNIDAATALCAELPDAVPMACDVSDEASVQALVDAAVERWGRLDVMVNNAGIVGATGPISTLSLEDWTRVHSVVLNGVFFGIKHAARVMIPQNSGAIVTVASLAGLMGGVGPHAYTAAKHGVVGIVKSAASELAQHRIRVNGIAPAGVVTPLLERLRGSREKAIAENAKGYALGTALMPEEVAESLLFLAGDGAAHITGQILAIDSGLSTIGARMPAFHMAPQS